MLKNTYILYINEARSVKYRDECVESVKATCPEANVIPVEGYNEASYQDICKEFGIGIIPYYVEQMNTNSRTLNRAFSCTAGHIKIWKLIAASGQPGVVLEHDAICKGDYTNLTVSDDDILWLGPRIDKIDDYAYIPSDPVYVDVDRWEGTHAYAITPAMATRLLACMKQYGLNDSLDGQLGMRNMFDIKFKTVDIPPVVAVVGDRESCIESSGNPGFWNAYNTIGFLQGCKPGAKVAPERKLIFHDTSFNDKKDEMRHVLTASGLSDDSEKSVLVVNAGEGLSTLWLSNQLLKHNDSYMHVLVDGGSARLCQFNTYFSKYYYKLNYITVDKPETFLIDALKDNDIGFDCIYYHGKPDCNETAANLIIQWNLLKDGGILIVDNANDTITKAFAEIAPCVNRYSNFVVFGK